MSIALNAKVEALEKRVEELERMLAKTASQDAAQQLNDRIAALEARKPGPKPKDAQ
jgi:hypothetical protein